MNNQPLRTSLLFIIYIFFVLHTDGRRLADHITFGTTDMFFVSRFSNFRFIFFLAQFQNLMTGC